MVKRANSAIIQDMVIGIEAERANNPQKTGVEHYAKQLILHLAQIDKANSYVLYLRTKPENWFLSLPSNFKVKVIPFPIFWTQLRISWEMFLRPVDVLFIPASALPIIHPKKSVVTIHDLAWKYFPDSFTSFMRNFLEWSTGFAVKRASAIIAVSQSTKNDLVKFCKVDAAKVFVIHHGFGEASRADDNLSQSLKSILPQQYVLFLSTLQPRKNLEKLIDAFRVLKSQNTGLPHKLVVAGRPGWKFESILEKIKQNADIAVYLNHVSDEDRFILLRRADMLVLPSFYEGFGMQILEAFDAGTPVATSNVSSMPEVAGEAAVYFNPSDVNDIAGALKMVLDDKSLADKLRQAGKNRLKDFAWEKCARETLGVLSKIK